jgi:hypothetical protein
VAGHTISVGACILALGLVLVGFGGLGAVGFATAHPCRADTIGLENHADCNGHECRRNTAPHDHYTDHTFGTGAIVHWCWASSSGQDKYCMYLNGSGDVTINPNGQGGCIFEGISGPSAVINIIDPVVQPVSGLICWNTCGTSATAFCGAVSATVTSSRLLVFVDGPVLGNPILSPCGTFSASAAGAISVQT